MSKSPQVPVAPKAILCYAKDLPNICSLAGLLCATLGIYFAFLGNFPAAMIGQHVPGADPEAKVVPDQDRGAHVEAHQEVDHATGRERLVEREAA